MFNSVLLIVFFTFPRVFSVSLSFESSAEVSNLEKRGKLFNPHQGISEKKNHGDPVEEFFKKVVLIKDDKFLPPGFQFGPPNESLEEIGSRQNNDKKYINEETLIEDVLGENTSESKVKENLINEESAHAILNSLFNDNHLREQSNELKSESIQAQKFNVQTFPEAIIFDEEILSEEDQINLHKDKSLDEDALIETFLVKEVFSERTSDELVKIEELLIEEGASNNIDDLNTDLEIKEKIFDWKITKDHFETNKQFKSNIAPKQFVSPRSSLSPTSNNPPKSSTSPKYPPKIPQTFNSHPSLPSISNSPLKSSPISLFSIRKRKHKTQKEKKKPALKKAMTKLKFDMSKIDFESILESSQSRERAISKPVLDKIPELDTQRFKYADVGIPNIESIDVATATIGFKDVSKSVDVTIPSRKSSDVTKSADVTIPATKSSDVSKSADVTIPATKSSAVVAFKASVKDVSIQSFSKTPTIVTTAETTTAEASSRSTSTKSTTKVATMIDVTSRPATKSTRRVTKTTTTTTTTEAISIPLATEESSITEETTISTTEKTPRSPTNKDKVTSRSTITATSMKSSMIEAISRSTTETTTKSKTQMTSLSTPITAITRTLSRPNKDTSRSTTLKTTTVEEILKPTITETSSRSTTERTLKSVTEAPSRSLISSSCGDYCGIDGTFLIKSGIDWSRELRNTSALNLFKTVSREIIVDLIRIFRNSSIGSSFRSVHVNSLYPKSKQSADIVVDIYVRLRGNNSDDTVDKVKTVFSEGLVNSSLGRFGIDESRAKFSFSKDRAPLRRKVNKMEILDIILPDWAWMGIGVLTVSVSFIGILGMVFACNRRRKARDVNVMSPHVLAHIRKKMSLDGIYDDSFTEDIIQDIRSSVSGCNHTHRTSVREETRSSASGCNHIRRTVRDETDYNLHRTGLMDETEYRSRSRSEGSRTHQQNRGKRGVNRGDSYRPRAATDSYGPRESYRPNGYKRGRTSREMQINHKNMLLNGSTNQHNVSKRSTTNIYKRNNKRPNVGLYDSRSPSVSSQDIGGTSVSSYDSDSRRPSVSSCDSRQQLVNVGHEEILSSNIFMSGGNLRNGGNQRGRNDRSSCLVQRQVISSDEETIYDNILTNQSRTSEKMVGKAKRFVYTKDSWSGGVYAVPRTKRRTPLPGFETPKYEDDLPTSPDNQNTTTESSGSSLESPSNMVRMLSYRKI